jgi:hypothetical protein
MRLKGNKWMEKDIVATNDAEANAEYDKMLRAMQLNPMSPWGRVLETRLCKAKLQ